MRAINEIAVERITSELFSVMRTCDPTFLSIRGNESDINVITTNIANGSDKVAGTILIPLLNQTKESSDPVCSTIATERTEVQEEPKKSSTTIIQIQKEETSSGTSLKFSITIYNSEDYEIERKLIEIREDYVAANDEPESELVGDGE